MTIIIIHKPYSIMGESMTNLVTRLESFGYKVATAEMKPSGSPEMDIIIHTFPDPVLKKEPVHRVPTRRGMIKSK